MPIKRFALEATSPSALRSLDRWVLAVFLVGFGRLQKSEASTSGSPRAANSSLTSGVIYDDQIVFQNPLLSLSPACEVEVKFYRVSRPIAPAVNHIFVGVHIAVSQSPASEGQDTTAPCREHGLDDLKIYGATKGESDLTYFRQLIESSDSTRLMYVGRAHRSVASGLLDEAVRISQVWQQSLQSTPYFVSRMVATPLMGRICAKSATEVLTALEPHLRR